MSSQERIMELFFRLYQGEHVDFPAEAAHYDCSDRTMTRDKAVLADALARDQTFHLAYDGPTHATYLDRSDQLTVEEVVALVKMVIGTRALSTEEMHQTVTHLLALMSLADRKRIKQMITTTMAHYVPVGHSQNLLTRLAQFTTAITNKQLVQFTYQSSVKNAKPHQQTGQPLSLYFADFYFYVVMYLDQVDKSTVFRLDRFLTVRPLVDQVGVPADKKVDEGAMRNKTYLLNGGHELHYRFRYWGYPQTALDKLPKSKLVQQFKDGSVEIEGDMFSQGALLWVLGQGALIKVLAPQSLKEEVKESLQKALSYYK